MTNKLVKFASSVGKKPELSDSEATDTKDDNLWHVLVVDDDQAVHDITDLVLSKFQFDNKPLKLTYAYSAAEARKLLEQPNEFAVLLLDVVMETEHAGLDLVSYIRNVLKNQFLRIVLRTGQPGQAPELSVIVDYDINDYRTKTELTAEKMCSCMTSALRSYRDINTIRKLASVREELNHKLRHEIEERYAVEQLLSSTNDKLESIINNSTALISLKDTNGRYELVNKSFMQDLGINSDEVIGKRDCDVFAKDIAELVRHNDEEVVKTGEAIQCEELFPTADGEHFYLCVKFPLYDTEGKIHRICSICTDITDRLEAQNEILYLAQYDSLTNIPNRSLFIEKLTEATSRSEWEKNHAALIFIDLDRFKQINDTLGHDTGDALLIQVAERLQSVVREDDSICRLGGDEFAVLLNDITSERDIQNVVEKMMESVTQSYMIDGRELVVTASMGISRCPVDSKEVQVLLKKADVAMYKAKQAGRNTYRFYSQSDDSEANELLSLEVDMRKMLDQQDSQLFLLYQPKVNIHTGQYSSVEALVRWKHPKKGIISPAQFIPLLEETGLITEVGEWVLREACTFVAKMNQTGLEIKVAVNLSSRQLKQQEIVNTIKQILKETGCSPQWLELEVTESSLVDDIETTKVLLEEISNIGVRLAIDDFGTGYSSMSYLKRLPFNTLKIDRSFISDAPKVKQDLAIVTTIVQLATNLNMNVVAEGVETNEQYHTIKKLLDDSDNHLIQGYIFSKPMLGKALTDIQKDITKIWNSIERLR